MNIKDVTSAESTILNPGVQDASGLNDFQKVPSQDTIEINKVGIERFRFPILLNDEEGNTRSHDAEASMFVNLEKGKTGANMSRFCKILQEETYEQIIDYDKLTNILLRFKDELRDSTEEDFIDQSYLSLSYNQAFKQKSLKSDNWGWQYYKITIDGFMNKSKEAFFTHKMEYEYSSTCPCSLSMSKQYEKEFKEGLISEGNGIASAHSQRSVAHTKITFSHKNPVSSFEIVDMLRTALPTETQSLVKRVDEQAFAILNAQNPMFVEHASRNIAKILNSEDRILDWSAKVEHLESLHSHNAVAYISKSSH